MSTETNSQSVTLAVDPRTAANEIVKRLRAEGYDAFRHGSYHDISGKVWETIVNVLNEFSENAPTSSSSHSAE